MQRRWILAVGLAGLVAAFASRAVLPANTSLSYDATGATLSFGSAPWRAQVGRIQVYTCRTDELCDTLVGEPSGASGEVRLTGEGLYRVVFHPTPAAARARRPAGPLWSQRVAVVTSQAEFESLATRYAPKFVFHKDEKYFPVSISTLFDRPLHDFDVSLLVRGSKSNVAGADLDIWASQAMRDNAHEDARLHLRKSVARAIAGPQDPSDFPVYWTSMKSASGNRAWISYILFYAFDEKYYTVLGDLSGKADHSIDRESVTLELQKLDGVWTPARVVYAGHLSSQRTTFLGCDEPVECKRHGVALAAWDQGRTSLAWSNTVRIGEAPVVHVVHGAHAMTPAYGWYEIDYGALGIADPLIEPAGNPDLRRAVAGRLQRLDLSSAAHSALTFSGRFIDGRVRTMVPIPPTGLLFLIEKGDWVPSFPFIRFPTGLWADEASRDFDRCISQNAGCRPYMLPPSGVPFEVASDAMVFNAHPNRNFDSDATLLVCGMSWGITGKSMLQFDHRRVPTAARTVYLNLDLVNSHNLYDAAIEAYPIASPWVDQTVTWNTLPAVNWTRPSGAVHVPPGRPLGATRIDITQMVKEWQSGTANHGVMLDSRVNTWSGCRTFGSLNASTGRPFVSWE